DVAGTSAQTAPHAGIRKSGGKQLVPIHRPTRTPAGSCGRASVRPEACDGRPKAKCLQHRRTKNNKLELGIKISWTKDSGLQPPDYGLPPHPSGLRPQISRLQPPVSRQLPA